MIAIWIAMGTPLQFIIASAFKFSGGTRYWCRQHLGFYVPHLFSTSFLLFNQENGKGKLLPSLISSRNWALAGSLEHGFTWEGGDTDLSKEVRLRSSCFELLAVPGIVAGLERQEGTFPSSIPNPSSGLEMDALSRKSVLASIFPISFTGAIFYSIKQFCTCIQGRHRSMWILNRNLYLCLIRSWLLSYPNPSDAISFSGPGFKWAQECKVNIECGVFLTECIRLSLQCVTIHCFVGVWSWPKRHIDVYKFSRDVLSPVLSAGLGRGSHKGNSSSSFQSSP